MNILEYFSDCQKKISTSKLTSILLITASLALLLLSPEQAHAVPTITWSNPGGYAINQGDNILVPPPNTFTVNADDVALVGNGPDSIDVLISSSTGDSITLTLNEIMPDDLGMFTNTNLIFTHGPAEFQVTDTATINIQDDCFFGTGNCDPGAIEPLSAALNGAFVCSNSDPGCIFIDLIETGPNTGIFTRTLQFSTIGSDPATATIFVAPGDVIMIGDQVTGAFVNGLIIPAPSDVGSIPAEILETVTATYGGVSVLVNILDDGAPGRGGGGAVRPGLVLNFIFGGGALATGGSSGGGGNPPSFGQSSFAIISGGEEGFGGILNDNDANTLDQTKTFKVGEKAVLRFDFTEGGGIGKIEHIGLYANVRDGQKRQDSDAYIFYDPFKSPPVTVHDPNGLFSEANFELLQMDVTKFVLKYELTFAKPMAMSDLIRESWNLKKWSSINKIPNAIEVISSGIVQEEQSAEPIVDTFLEDVTDDKVIPVWVKSNAKWWSDDKIDNDNFISGLEYLVNEGIITVSLTEESNNSISEIQPWIKSTAGWWADGMISEDEFITAIEWMISNNIIQVAA